MYHDVNQVKVLFEDVRDMYDEDTYQAISVLIDKYLTTGYLSKDEQKELFQYLRRTNQVNKSESKIENDSHEVEKGIEDWEDDLEDQTNNVPNRKSTLILPQSVLILIMLMRKLIKMALRGKIMKNEFKKLSNRQKIAYYKSVGNDSLADNRRAIDKNNEGQGLTWRQVKINSKNLQKLMKKRGLSQFDTTQLKKSFAKWDGQNNHKGGNVTARHAKANEKYVITQTKGESASGVFVSKKSLGNSPQERIDKGALPPSNKANQEKRVALGKDQNVISGKIAQQPSFKEQDPAHGERRGGGKQVVTAGGFSTGAVKNINKNGGKKMASSEKDRGNAFKQSLKVNVPQGQAKSSGKKNAFNNSPSKGQRERTRSQSQTKSKGMSR